MLVSRLVSFSHLLNFYSWVLSSNYVQWPLTLITNSELRTTIQLTRSSVVKSVIIKVLLRFYDVDWLLNNLFVMIPYYEMSCCYVEQINLLLCQLYAITTFSLKIFFAIWSCLHRILLVLYSFMLISKIWLVDTVYLQHSN